MVSLRGKRQQGIEALRISANEGPLDVALNYEIYNSTKWPTSATELPIRNCSPGD